MNGNENLKDIYAKFLQNKATRYELERMFELLKDNDEQELKQLVAQVLEQNEQHADIDKHHQLLQNVRVNVMNAAGASQAKIVALQPRLRKMWYMAAASVAAILIVAGVFFINKKQTSNSVTDLRPGGNIAMLSLGGSDTLNLQQLKTGSKVKRSAGVVVSKVNNNTVAYTAYGNDTAALTQVNTIVTPKGGQYRVQLSDGTEVMLNADSKLEFPVGFTGHQRRVKLTGEAYFAVSKNKAKPFIVSAAGQEVQVLGTKFNISNYTEDSGPVTTLTEGSVKVSTSSAMAILKPGQQSRAVATGISVADVDPDTYNAWRNGEFVFENTPLDVIMHKLSRWYNFEIDYSKLPQKSLYMRISSQVNLSDVLNVITTTSGVKFKIEERRVVVM